MRNVFEITKSSEMIELISGQKIAHSILELLLEYATSDVHSMLNVKLSYEFAKD